MNNQPNTEPSIWERSNFIRAFRWLVSWRGIRRVLIVLAWTVTVVGLFYGEENWRGRRAWNQYREATEARGVSLDYATYIPKPVPDEQNFAATPFLKSFLQPAISILTNDLWFRANNNITTTMIAKDKGRRHFTDLAAWQAAAAALQSGPLKDEQRFETGKTDFAARAAAAPAVLEGMMPDAATFAELRAASTRPFSRYPVVYDMANPCDTMIPHLSKVKGVCQRLSLEACAELAAGQSDAALADVKLILALADSIKSEPYLISFLLRAACVQIAIQSVWEGLAEQRWTEAQLQELQARLLPYDFLADLQPTLKAERASRLIMVDLAQKMSFEILPRIEEGPNLGTPEEEVPLYVLGRVMPSGWYYLEKLNYSTLFDGAMEGVVDLAAKKVSPRRVASNAGEWTRQILGGSAAPGFNAMLRHRLMAAMLPPPMGNPIAAARCQTAADQAALACALERYRLANGQFPDALAALAPRYISLAPNDVITGQPYKYRRAAAGQFILYSVGWNEKDDGGVPGRILFDDKEGDWVWSYPAN